MRRSPRYISLRVKITGAFIAIVVVGTAVGSYIGSRIVTRAMLEEAQKRVRNGIETARMIYTLRLERVQRSVARAASNRDLTEAIRRHDLERAIHVLQALDAENALDFLGVVSDDGIVATSGGRMAEGAIDPRQALPLDALGGGEQASGTVVLDEAFLSAWHPDLAERARMRVVPVEGPIGDGKTEVRSGLVLLAMVPLRIEGVRHGILYGGVLLNRNQEVVEQIKQAVFGSETYGGREVGTATIFLEDVRVSTTVRLEGGERAEGTRVSARVAEKVLKGGEPFLGRAFVVNDYYVTAYEPIRDLAGRIVGMLYVGVLEAPYLAVRTSMMLSFLAMAGAGVVIVFGLTWWITRRITKPLMEMVAASKRIAAGDMDHPVEVSSRDEIGHLAVSFNKMQESLARAREEIENWTRTLEERVRERTEELSAVQARMAQAERLAAIGRLAAGVAHEINNPLGGIMTFAMLAQEDCPPDHPLRRNLDIIVAQTMRCREIVKGLLEFSRQSDSQPVETDVSEVVEKTLALLQSQAIFQNIRLEKRLSQGLPPVLIDPGQLQQVVMNLVLNAVDAMEEDGNLTVETNVDEAFGGVVLRVSDTGRGIPKEVLPFIFEPFFTTKPVGKGTGLGLAIVHGIVTRAGGRIDVDTSPGGTTFAVRIPAAKGGPSNGAQREGGS